MKKILFVSESLGIGGMERVLVTIANALVIKGYDITIILYQDSEDKCQRKNELDSRVHLFFKEKKQFLVLGKLPYIHRFYKKELWEARSSAKKLYKYYVGNQTKYDVEIGFYRGPSIKIVSGSTNKNSNKLAWVHTDFKICDPKSITRFFKSIEDSKKAYSKYDHIACVSKAAKESFNEVIGFQDKTTTIYNMIPRSDVVTLGQEKCPLEKRCFTILTVGRLIPAKGYDKLLKAVKKLNDDGYVFELWIVGAGWGQQDIFDLAKELKLDNVTFCGMQKNPYPYMKNADLYVCSSIREGFNLTIAEAMSFGIPIVSTPCTGPVEILGNGEYGILTDNCDEDGIYKTLKYVLDNKAILEPFRQKSLDRSKDFDAEKIITEIEKLF